MSRRFSSARGQPAHAERADAGIDRVRLRISGVHAEALLIVRLDKVARIIDRTPQIIDNNQKILTNL